MRHDWIEDVLAVAETGSFQAAAERRRVTQPAFSRRLRTIEESLGVRLFDRSAKPARPLPHVVARLDAMREIAAGLRELSAHFREDADAARSRIVIACQHAITTATAPALVERVSGLDLDVRLRSANRDECLAQLLTRRADLALVYDVDGSAPLDGADYLVVETIGTETLVPVASRAALGALDEGWVRGELPIVAYPEDVFLGAVQRARVFAPLRGSLRLRIRLETALTTAALQCARAGLGVAWVPRSLAADDIAAGTLVDLGRTLPVVAMRLIATRLRGVASPALAAAWPRIVALDAARAAPDAMP
ncbi:LysR family transcriptional regulator [Salinarimonas rosea]|uniref:LysR family transcriptional regulator n=1 Tax=Salinarimonas rosea TaxID=552063 RepID=UPI0003FA60A3|nr:LysR family transcriptional regulator [Salinarimonas rosea]